MLTEYGRVVVRAIDERGRVGRAVDETGRVWLDSSSVPVPETVRVKVHAQTVIGAVVTAKKRKKRRRLLRRS